MSARITRVLPFVLALGLGTTAAGFGCKAKPSEKACREAIENIRRISGQDANDVGADPIAAVRSCRGNSSKAAVECMRTAKTIADLEKCEAEGGLAAPATEAKGPPATEPAPTEAPAIDPVGHAVQATGLGGDAGAAKVPADTDAANADSVKADSANAEAANADSVKADSANADSAKADSANADSANADSAKTGSATP